MNTTHLRSCLVTGSATGIGAACAEEFARHGWAVGICHLDAETVGEARQVAARCEALGAQVLVQQLDVADDAQCRSAVQAVQARWGRLDALVNCAGTTRFIPHGDLEALDAAEFRRVYDVNLVGAFQMIRAARALLEQGDAASVVNISSIGGLFGRGSSLAYAASKAALNALTLSTARSLAPAIRVNAIAPGFVDGGLPSRVTPAQHYGDLVRQQTEAAALRRVAQPQEIAAMAWFLSTSAPSMTGDVIVMDNGLHLNAG